MSKNNNLVLFVVLGLLLIFAIYCIANKDGSSEVGSSKVGFSHQRKSNKSKSKQNIPEIEYIGGSGSNYSFENESIENDAFELLDVASDYPALQLQMGVGPGLYGSGRHTSEMVGN